MKLNDGLPFRIALLEDVPIDTEVGHSIHFRVLDGVQSGDTLVINASVLLSGLSAELTANSTTSFG